MTFTSAVWYYYIMPAGALTYVLCHFRSDICHCFLLLDAKKLLLFQQELFAYFLSDFHCKKEQTYESAPHSSDEPRGELCGAEQLLAVYFADIVRIYEKSDHSAVSGGEEILVLVKNYGTVFDKNCGFSFSGIFVHGESQLTRNIAPYFSEP